jgi:hypothetical protein
MIEFRHGPKNQGLNSSLCPPTIPRMFAGLFRAQTA